MGARENVVARSIPVSIGTLVFHAWRVWTHDGFFPSRKWKSFSMCDQPTTSYHVFKFISWDHKIKEKRARAREGKKKIKSKVLLVCWHAVNEKVFTIWYLNLYIYPKRAPATLCMHLVRRVMNSTTTSILPTRFPCFFPFSVAPMPRFHIIYMRIKILCLTKTKKKTLRCRVNCDQSQTTNCSTRIWQCKIIGTYVFSSSSADIWIPQIWPRVWCMAWGTSMLPPSSQLCCC